MYAKQSEYKEFLDAIKKGRAEGLNQVSNALFEKATQGNVTAMIYYLKVRDRENWGENQLEPLREIPPMPIVIDSRFITQALKYGSEVFLIGIKNCLPVRIAITLHISNKPS